MRVLALPEAIRRGVGADNKIIKTPMLDQHKSTWGSRLLPCERTPWSNGLGKECGNTEREFMHKRSIV